MTVIHTEGMVGDVIFLKMNLNPYNNDYETEPSRDFDSESFISGPQVNKRNSFFPCVHHVESKYKLRALEELLPHDLPWLYSA